MELSGVQGSVACFCCLEEVPAPVFVCKCEWLPVHIHCQKKFIEASGKTSCQYCGCAYNNVLMKRGAWVRNRSFYAALIILISECILMLLCIYLFIEYVVFQHLASLYVFMSSLGLFIAILVTGTILLQTHPPRRTVRVHIRTPEGAVPAYQNYGRTE